MTTTRPAARFLARILLAATILPAAACRRSPGSGPPEAAVETPAAAPDADSTPGSSEDPDRSDPAAAPDDTAVADTPAPPPDASAAEAVVAAVEAPAPAGGSVAAADIPSGDCGSLHARYLAVRASLDRCERDGDCAEIWPGLCPHGPHYVHRESDVPGLSAIEQRILDECPVAECEKPEYLGIARCEAGRCVAGREPPREGPLESCWDTEETYLADGGRVQGITQEHLRGVTPLVVYGAAAPGTLRITVEWSPYCDDCRLEISEHNSGMASLVEGTRRREGPVEEIALPATPGPYYLVGRRAGPSVPFLVVATLVRADGLPAASTLHGVSWQRRCED
jgi:hypothetical protein